MRKCSKCETLYSENAQFCMYCKIPLADPEIKNSENLTFVLHKEVSKEKAEELKIGLMMRGFNCAVVNAENESVDGLYNILIAEEDKGNVFKVGAERNAFGGLDSGNIITKKTSIFSVIIFIVFVLLSVAFCIYFTFYSTPEVKEPVTIYEGNVDPNISDRKSYMPKKKRVHRPKSKVKKIERKKTKIKTKSQN